MSGPNISIDVEIEALNKALPSYIDLTKKTPQEVLLKQGASLAFDLSRRLKILAPAKGSIRSERLEALRTGGGIKIREAAFRFVVKKYSVQGAFGRHTIGIRKKLRGVKGFTERIGVESVKVGGKRLNIPALMAKREIAIRESGSGFLAISAKYPRTLRAREAALSRIGRVLSESNLIVVTDGGSLTFSWNRNNPQAAEALVGLQTPNAQGMIAAAIADRRQDMLAYIQRKLDENARKAGFN